MGLLNCWRRSILKALVKIVDYTALAIAILYGVVKALIEIGWQVVFRKSGMMRKLNLTFAWLVIFIVLLLLFLTKDCGSADWNEVDKEAKRLTVIVSRVDIHNKTQGWGTGVIIDDSIIVTCSHTLTFPNVPIILFNKRIYRATIIDSTPGKDGLALLKVNTYLTGNPPKINKPVLWDKVLTYGHHSGFPEMSQVGYINGLAVDTTKNYDIYSLQLSSNNGISGGGVWNKDGELVGIIWGVREYGNIVLTAFASAEAVKKMYRNYLTIKSHSRKFNRRLRRP